MALGALSIPVQGQTSTVEQAAQEGLRRQEERTRDQQQSLEPRNDVLRNEPTRRASSELPQESPCFLIDDLVIDGPDAWRFAWLRASFTPFADRCIGVEGLRRVASVLDDALISQGYATTRVSLPVQNLRSGTLHVALHGGRIEALRMEAGGQPDRAWGTWWNAFPTHAGALLNIRDLEQGVEQMTRLPSQSVTTRIEPGEAPDTSVVVIERRAGTLRDRAHGGLTLDNSGSSNLGRTVLSAYGAFDNPLGLNDIVNLSGNSNAEQPNGSHRSQGASISYSIPFGYSSFSISASHSRFAQYVQGTTVRFLSSGDSDTAEARWNYIAWRSASTKLGVYGALSTRRAESYLDDVELVVQRRRTTNVETGLTGKQILGSGSLEFELGYRRGADWLDAQEDLPSEAGLTLRPRIWTLSASFNQAFQVAATGTATDANPTAGDLVASAGGKLTVTPVEGHYEIAIARGGNFDGRTSYSNESSTTNQLAQLTAAHDLTLVAQGDVALTGATASAGRDVAIQGANVTIAAAKDRVAADVQNVSDHGYSHALSDVESAVGGSVQAGRDIAVQTTTGDIRLTGASLHTDAGAINLAASRDVVLDTLALQSHTLNENKDVGHGFLASETSTSRQEMTAQAVQGSTLSGTNVGITSGRDVVLNAATVVADKALTIDATRDVTIGTATEQVVSSSEASHRTSGVFGAGAGFTIGSRQLDQSVNQTQESERTTTLASLGGDISITAGGDYRQRGGTLITGERDANGRLSGGGDIAIDARSIEITEARQNTEVDQATKFRQGGLTVAVKSPIIDMIQGADSLSRAASQTSDPRMKALAGATAVVETARGLQALGQTTQGGQAPEASVRLSISIGNSRSSSETHTTESTAQGATLAASGNLSLNAHGAGADSTLTARGAQLSAAGDATLKAEGDLKLEAAQDRATYQEDTKSQSASIGVSFGVGKTTGWSIDVAAATAKGNADGQSTSWSAGNVTAGGTLKLSSGGDTVISGTQVRGERLEAKVGGDLTIESLKDGTDYSSSQTSAGMQASIGFSTGGGSLSASKSKLDAHAHGVTDQAGLFAGTGGFDVEVGGQTTLKGAVIASQSDADKNRLSTGTLVTEDLANDGSVRASTVGFSASSSGPGLSPGIAYAQKNEDEHSATRSAIAQGSITIRDEAGQLAATGQTAAETVQSLNRDTADAHTPLSGLYDISTLKRTEAEVGADAAIMQRAAAAGFKEAGNYAKAQVDEANAKDYAAGKVRDAAAQETDPARAAQLNAYADQLTADAASQRATWEEGGAGRIALHTVVGALTGGVAGAAGAAANQSAQPLLEAATSGIENETLRNVVREAASTVIGAAVGGGTGAATALSADVNNRQLHPKEIDWIKANSKTFAKQLSETLGRSVSEGEAQIWLAEAGYANIDDLAQRTAGNSIAGRMGSDDYSAYMAAKQFIAQQSKGTGGWTDDRGLTQHLFQASNADFQNPTVYSNNNASQSYRDFYWNTLGINVPPPTGASAQEQAIYDARAAEQRSEGIQFQLLDRIPVDSFTNPRSLIGR
jgi:hemolysin activation/secretion protein